MLFTYLFEVVSPAFFELLLFLRGLPFKAIAIYVTVPVCIFLLLSLYLFKICLQGQFLWEKISLRQIITKIVGFLQTGKYVIC